MNQPVCRRSVIALALFLPLQAVAAGAFDGSWGAQVAPGETMQIVLTSGKVIAFFWQGDYTGTSAGKLAAGGSRLDFTFKGGTVSLAMAGRDLAVTLHGQGDAVRKFVLKRD